MIGSRTPRAPELQQPRWTRARRMIPVCWRHAKALEVPTRWMDLPRDSGTRPRTTTTSSTSTRRPRRHRPCGSAAEALALAEVEDDDLAHVVTAAACFPSAVKMTATEVELDLDRPLTVTERGCSFSQRAMPNNYVMRYPSPRWRYPRRTQVRGLVTANGGYIAERHVGVSTRTAQTHGFRHAEPRARSTPYPPRAVRGTRRRDAGGTWTAMHDRDGQPETSIMVGLLNEMAARALGPRRTTPRCSRRLTPGPGVAPRPRIAPDGTTELL